MVSCPLLRRHVADGTIGYGINHRMVDFKNNRRKNLDLVLCRPASTDGRRRRTFTELAIHYEIPIAEEERSALEKLPVLMERPVGGVLMALEAKACMTAHQRALPRLYDELNSSHLTTHGAAGDAIAAGFVMVNAADTFVSPDLNKASLGQTDVVRSRHNQPRDAGLAVDKIRQIPRRAGINETGFDAMGVLVVECKNDGSAVAIVEQPPAPQPGDIFHYSNFVDRLSHLYSTRFGYL